MVIWFHSFPDESEVINDSQLFEQISLSAFQVASDNVRAKKLFSGHFNDFINFAANNNSFNDVAVILPASKVLYTNISVPSKSKNRIMQALPFLLDDFFVSDMGKEHIALGDVESGQCNIAIVKHHIIENIYTQFKKLSLPVSIMTSEIFQLPWYEGKWSMCFLHDNVLIRTGAQSGVTSSIDNIDFIFNLLLNNSDLNQVALNNDDSGTENAGTENTKSLKRQDDLTSSLPDSFIIYTSENTESIERISAIAQKHSIQLEIVKDNILKLCLCDKNNKSNSHRWGINLLQGKYLAANLNQVKIPFKKTLAAVFILFLFSQMFFMGYQWISYKKSVNQFEAQLEQLYFKTFPDSKRLIDVRTQAENNLLQLQNKSSTKRSFLNLLGLVGDEIRRNKDIEIQALQYNDGILQLNIISKGFIFNDLKSSLENNNMTVEDRSSSRIKGKVHSLISFKLN